MLQWVREESLATVQTATIVELPPTREGVIGGVGTGGRNESFWSKVARQIGDTKVRLHLRVEPRHHFDAFVLRTCLTTSSILSRAS